ncbi:hypothetical protein TH61_04025 [Rufibacter sp. DG15C]|uniref:DUF4199 domain-containing protein n=1 Tax=Rufibacter sp. DG15C TaxID=1379909 RepID=UPI00078CEE8A|nr:DUF4199 domain-containing protein [Rufibacter sp. DG15C]AMM50511.1 hypothetical protein TH61_04025 [Rufibacter sp. DG15C]
MLDRSIVNISARYGLVGGVVSFIYGLCLYFIYHQNPYSEQTELSATLLFVPTFVFLGVKYFKKYIDTEIGFGKAFKVAFITVLILAGTVALLQLIYTLLIGNDLVPQFITEAQAELTKSRPDLVKSVGVENYEMMKQEVGTRNAFSLGMKQWTLRMLVGFFMSIVSAVFFRK